MTNSPRISRGLLALPLLAALTACEFGADSTGGGAAGYETDWSAALARSREERKPILLNFGGPW